MISLENVRIFMRAVETGSFSAAGRKLRLSPSVVSYRIQLLEDHLNSRLLTRTTRSMSLTEAGRVFFDRCIEVVEAVERAEASVALEGGAAPRGNLHVTTPLGLGRRVIAPMLARYRTLQPHTEVRLRLSDHLLDLVQEGVDVAIRIARMEDSSFTLRKIADVRRLLCASPDYLAKRGAPAIPQDLAAHDCLLLRFPGSQQFRWTLDFHGEAVTIPIAGPLDADDGDVLTQWALDGLGIVLKPLFEVAPLIAEGRLVEVLPEAPPLPVTLGILYPSRRMLPPRTKSFIDLSVEEMRRHLTSQLAVLGPQKQTVPA
ncbi:MAG TPA: LysR family transcriptional regulator [Roseiarcus sp.]|jgi:DNA-binding transcriptional LysR family regulator